MAFGDTSTAYGWGSLDDSETEIDNSFYSLFDTGSRSIMISSEYFDEFISKLFDAAPDVSEWSYSDGIVETGCEAELPSIFFMFD